MSPRRSSRARSAAHHGNSHTSTSSHSSTSSTRRSRKSRYGGDSHGVTRAESYDEIEEPVDEDMEDNYSGAEEEEGETRCVCGLKEYQGGSDDSHTDLTDGLFIQCDQCHVWQHGLCVGIRDKALAPDNYFCEQCKPENHTLYEKKGGRTYSTYIGFGPERVDTSKDHPTKRRSTMNSRDAAYDEQILNQVIEQSRLDDKKSISGRSRKRGTSETSDEHHTKRQRTSDSPEKIESNHTMDDSTDRNSNGSRKARNGRAAPTPSAPAHPSTQSGSKRASGRSRGERDNRRDESEQSEEPPRPTRNTATSTKAEEPLPVISTPLLEVSETPSMHKRISRQRRRGGTRNNRTSEDPGENSSHAMARDVSAQGTDTNGVHDRPAKPRLPNSRTTIQEMRRRVTGISDFIAKQQVEMVGQRQRTTVFGALVSATSTGALNTEVLFNLLDQTKTPNSGAQSATSTPISGIADKVTVVTDKPEAEPLVPNTISMSSLELMDLVMKRVNHWELTYNRQIERVH
ncbi:hypothetical protein TWF694_008271 [Orbilia ellipsospora]|uniref:Zinc finger PHD-type domain-containing protein n=1 Tax=Orbilia ellipsospora TaxID=2528407 RepID=A0AAV9XM95_9PEZI